ncbi:MAG: hypothetical protein P8J91_04365, partial [Pirellulaceae bacterium]|nr:hypothetical protein [Pirellulaceae bacterium]
QGSLPSARWEDATFDTVASSTTSNNHLRPRDTNPFGQKNAEQVSLRRNPKHLSQTFASAATSRKKSPSKDKAGSSEESHAGFSSCGSYICFAQPSMCVLNIIL